MASVRFTRKNFRESVAKFGRKLNGLTVALLPTVVDLAAKSIVSGSQITGAPGQPEGEGDLKRSWRVESLGPARAAIVPSSPYARPNEDGVRKFGKPYVQHSSVGGRHSVKLTRRNFQRLVNVAAKMVTQKVS